MPYSAMVKEMEVVGLESVSGIPKVNQFLQLLGSIATPSFNEIG